MSNYHFDPTSYNNSEINQEKLAETNTHQMDLDNLYGNTSGAHIHMASMMRTNYEHKRKSIDDYNKWRDAKCQYNYGK